MRVLVTLVSTRALTRGDTRAVMKHRLPWANATYSMRHHNRTHTNNVHACRFKSITILQLKSLWEMVHCGYHSNAACGCPTEDTAPKDLDVNFALCALTSAVVNTEQGSNRQQARRSPPREHVAVVVFSTSHKKCRRW